MRPTSTIQLPFRDAAIEVRGLRKTYPGGVEAVKGIDFHVAAGEVFGLLGPNGAGKSTTIGMLTTAIKPSGGVARVAGFDISRQPMEVRRASSVVFQEAVVDRALTGRRNLETHARLWGVDRDDRAKTIDATIARFGLATIADRPVGTYSGGERRRLELARALVSRPEVLFLDEPTVGLDPRIRHELLDVIARLGAGGNVTVVLTTHYLDEAERLCDRVAVVHQGEIVAIDTPRGLLGALGPQVLELRLAGTDSDVLRVVGLLGESAFAVGSTITVPLLDRDWRTVADRVTSAGVAVTSTSTRVPTLDDVYLKLTGTQLAA
jgi:ABC-2 type transport system ATP-binding protein